MKGTFFTKKRIIITAVCALILILLLGFIGTTEEDDSIVPEPEGVSEGYVNLEDLDLDQLIEDGNVAANYTFDDESQVDVPEPNPASDFEYELTDDNNGVRIKKYKGTNPVISIPSQIEGLSVLEISDDFIPDVYRSGYRKDHYYSEEDTIIDVSQVFIPDSVTTIIAVEHSYGLFDQCGYLNYAKLSKNCPVITPQMFRGCESLKNFQIPESVTTIGNKAFADSGLTSIQIPESVVNFGWRIFEFCEKLSSVKLPDTMTFIPGGMFSYCDALKTIELPSRVEKLEYQCFGNSGISEIKLPQNLKEIGENCFWCCSSLESIEIPKSVKKIERNAFTGTHITEFIIPDSVTELDVFGDIDNLEVLRLPNSLKKIDRYLIGDDSRKTLRSVNLP
ncbi:MAG: leucine-rich repeat domain-containing protein [Treponema sp.]|nr:leucine-rich repeat domain-containing protein [Treponema sp.]